MFYIKDRFLKLSKKLPSIWANFVREYVSRSFQKRPNLVTLLTIDTVSVVLFVFVQNRGKMCQILRIKHYFWGINSGLYATILRKYTFPVTLQLEACCQCD